MEEGAHTHTHPHTHTHILPSSLSFFPPFFLSDSLSLHLDSSPIIGPNVCMCGIWKRTHTMKLSMGEETKTKRKSARKKDKKKEERKKGRKEGRQADREKEVVRQFL
jgi:hypothetical protein